MLSKLGSSEAVCSLFQFPQNVNISLNYKLNIKLQ